MIRRLRKAGSASGSSITLKGLRFLFQTLGFIDLFVCLIGTELVTTTLLTLIGRLVKRSSHDTRHPPPVEKCCREEIDIREFKIYDATVAKTSLKIASSSFSIYFAIMSVCVTFES